MWTLTTLLCFGLTLFALLRQFRDIPSPALRFVILALWGRLLLSYFPQVAFQPVAAGQSMMALYSAIIVAIGFLFIRSRYLLSINLIPFYIFFLIIALSALINTNIFELILDISRWGFFIVVALITWEGLRTYGINRVLCLYATVLVIPLILQFVGIGLGIRNFDSDGAVIYIGGYFSISAFWKLLFSLACVSALIRSRYDIVFLALSALCIVGIYFTNNRTSMAATLVVLSIFSYSYFTHRFDIGLKTIFTTIGVVMLFVMIPFAVAYLPEKYVAVFDLIEHYDAALENPGLLTFEERMAGTGRVGIWSNLLFEWRNAGLMQKIFGFGPDSFTGRFPHNDYVGMLYQFGVIGMLAFMFIMVWQGAVILAVGDVVLRERLLGCFGGFLVTTLTTDAVWNLESLIALAIICSVAWRSVEERRERAVAGARERRRLGARWATQLGR